jgi:hypothetical protein
MLAWFNTNQFGSGVPFRTINFSYICFELINRSITIGGGVGFISVDRRHLLIKFSTLTFMKDSAYWRTYTPQFWAFFCCGTVRHWLLTAALSYALVAASSGRFFSYSMLLSIPEGNRAVCRCFNFAQHSWQFRWKFIYK